MPTTVATVASQWPGLAALRLLLMLQALPRLLEELALPAGSGSARSFGGGAGCLLVSAAAIGRERTVYWNASNPLFQPAGENVLYVNTLDRINFVCPNNGLEYYKIYWTASRGNYLSCTGGSPLFNCRTMDSYLVIVQIFAADPTAPVFLTPVYFYTPSTGELGGLDQTSGGACQTRNLRITVRSDSATSGPDTGGQPTTAGGSSAPPISSASTAGTESALNSAKTTTQVTATDPAAAGTPAVTTGAKLPQPGATTGKDAEHPDYSRMSNLITGSGVAMPTVATVTGLTCLSILLQLGTGNLT